MDKLGKIVREKRIKRGETLKQMAKAIKCSEGFARHIEASEIVPISPRLVQELMSHLRIPRSKILPAARVRYKAGQKYYRDRGPRSA